MFEWFVFVPGVNIGTAKFLLFIDAMPNFRLEQKAPTRVHAAVRKY